jgi:hypothetical protein
MKQSFVEFSIITMCAETISFLSFCHVAWFETAALFAILATRVIFCEEKLLAMLVQEIYRHTSTSAAVFDTLAVGIFVKLVLSAKVVLGTAPSGGCSIALQVLKERGPSRIKRISSTVLSTEAP